MESIQPKTSRRLIQRTLNSLFVSIMLLGNCAIALAQPSIEIVTEREWTQIFEEILDDSDTPYLIAVKAHAQKQLDDSTRKIQNGVESKDFELAYEGARGALIGHLLSWYFSELSPLKGTPSWVQTRNALLANRRALVGLGLDSSVLEPSFHNMNRGARTLALPTIDSLN